MGSSTVSWSKGAARAGERGVRVVVAVRARAAAAAFWSQERRSLWSGVDVGVALRAVGLVVWGVVWWNAVGREGRGGRVGVCMLLIAIRGGCCGSDEASPHAFHSKPSCVWWAGRVGRAQCHFAVRIHLGGCTPRSKPVVLLTCPAGTLARGTKPWTLAASSTRRSRPGCCIDSMAVVGWVCG